MKLVIFFADMLRANLLFAENKASRRDDLEKLLESIGGTFFSNCITSGPDTPRSTGILFTGKTPKESGLQTRSKWPGPYLSPDQKTLFSWALSEKIPIKVVDKSIEHSGLFFPQELQMQASFFPDLDSLAMSEESHRSKDLKIFFITSDTYHDVVSHRHAHKSSHGAGSKLIAAELKEVISCLELAPGDQLILYSDHGCKLSNDKFDRYSLMDRDRSQVVFFHSQFKDPKLSMENSLFSMVDLHVIISGLIKNLALTGTAGKNGLLELPEARGMVHVEDHDTYSTKVGDLVRKWAVFSKGFEYYESLGKGPVVKFHAPTSQAGWLNAISLSQDHLSKHASNYAELKYDLDYLTVGFTKVPEEKLAFWRQLASSKNVGTNTKSLFWRIVTLKKTFMRRISHHLKGFIRKPSRVVSKSGSKQRLET